MIKVIRAIQERQIAIAVEAADVTGVQPAAAQCRRARRRVIPVPAHYRVAAHQHLPVWPAGTAAPAASATWTSTAGLGIPAEPSRAAIADEPAR